MRHLAKKNKALLVKLIDGK
jgi:hypothetical protein